MNFLETLLIPYKTYTEVQIFLEIFAALMGILSVVLASRRNIWVYPTGIVSTLLYSVMLFQWQLFGDMLINVYYTVMSIYGWVLWSKSPHSDDTVRVESLTRKEVVITAVISFFAGFFVLLIYYFKPFLEHGFQLSWLKRLSWELTWVNYLDAVTTAIFLVGMWLMAKRKIENWWFWIIGDLIAVPMFLLKGYAITSFQYLIFTGLALFAYRQWAKEIKEDASIII